MQSMSGWKVHFWEGCQKSVKENLFCPFFICGAGTNHHRVTLLHVFEKLGGPPSAKHRENEGMGFDE
jgi:hypothetical protein